MPTARLAPGSSSSGGEFAVGAGVTRFYGKRGPIDATLKLGQPGEIVTHIGEILQFAGQMALHAARELPDPFRWCGQIVRPHFRLRQSNPVTPASAKPGRRGRRQSKR